MPKKNSQVLIDADILESSLNPLINNEFVYVSVEPQTFNVYHVYLLERIYLQKYYRELLDILRKCSPGELVNVYINNYGGNLHTGIDLINAIKASHAQVVMHITGPIYSMAPLLALQGDKIKLENNSFMMFHDYSSFEMGKGSEIEAHVKHYRKFALDCFSQWCKGFLTKKEIDTILAGKDLYLDYTSCKERLSKMDKLVD